MENNRALPSGTTVYNRYRIERVLGAGGFGITYLVRDQQTGNVAAMKEYMPLDAAYRVASSQEVRPLGEGKVAAYEKFRKNFEDEARTMYQFKDHPNIANVNHLFRANNTVYYVMEFVEGQDLRQILRSRGCPLHTNDYSGNLGSPMTWEELEPIMVQAASALAHIHKCGIIHCDISPDNILLQSNRQVKLLDFGAAKSTLRGTIAVSVIMHKPGYTPPEQMSGRNMRSYTDVYALAATIYCCLVGAAPPSCDMRLMDDEIKWPSELGIPTPGPDWEAALKKGLAMPWQQRYQTVSEFWEDLTGAPLPEFTSLVNKIGTSHNGKVRKTVVPDPPKPPQPPQPPQPQVYPALECLQGMYVGYRKSIRDTVMMGVDPSQCNFIFPVGSPGISRRHVAIWVDAGQVKMMDMGSTYGTFFLGGGGGQKMTPHVAYNVPVGTIFGLGAGQVFRIGAPE